MKKVIVKNLAGVQTHGAQMEDPSAWIYACVAGCLWGKPERWQPASEAHDPADVLETERREVQPADGEQPAVMQEWVKLRAEYTVEIEDITLQHQLYQCIQSRKAEYPSPEDFMNAYFDGGQAALAALQVSRLAVKAKYPKPEE